MRKDSIGMFWEDIPKVKAVRVPPEPVWLHRDYLPDLETAKAHTWDFFTREEFIQAGLEIKKTGEKHQLLFDIECYPNYFLVLFQSVSTGKYIAFEKYNNEEVDLTKLKWMLDKFTVIGFFSKNYDIPMLSLFAKGLSNSELCKASNTLIVENVYHRELLKKYKTEELKIDHFDLIEIPAGSGSLKIYGARLHSKQLKDLPFPPDIHLDANQIIITRWYCANDLSTTGDLLQGVSKALELRVEMSRQHGIDLRSKSDPQIAETVICNSIKKITGQWPNHNSIDPGYSFKYKVPDFINFQTSQLQWVLSQIKQSEFVISESGSIDISQQLKDLTIKICDKIYNIGAGGIHSNEETISYVAGDDEIIAEKDVSAYYPNIIVNQQLSPENMDKDFIHIYNGFLDNRSYHKKEMQRIGIEIEILEKQLLE